MTATLECRSVSKRYGPLRALDRVSMQLEPGEVRGLIGPNGSGKSTLLRIIGGAEQASGGDIWFEGRRIDRFSAARRSRLGIAMKFQIPSVFGSLSVLENVVVALGRGIGILRWLSGRPTVERREAERLLELVGLSDVKDVHAAHLSHGQQQWLEIAMATSVRPRLLLLDEPTAGMSPDERLATEKILRVVAEQAASIIVEHDIDFVRRISDTITVLHLGHMVGEGTPDEVRELPQVRRAYLGGVV